MSFRLRITLVTIWLVFTLSLAAWWLVYGIQQTELLSDAMERAGMADLDILRKQKMLVMEGGILLISLLLGGGSLLYLTVKARSQSLKLKEFFATFSHDLKTSLTSLRLQAESLKEDFKDVSAPIVDRLVGDTVRLEVQLENSLFLANTRQRLFIEELDLRRFVESGQQNWPNVKIETKGDAVLKADARALESVIKNLFHNAINHGRATEITVRVNPHSIGGVQFTVSDNGQGFAGDVSKLGQLFTRHTSSSGSGVGLYLVRQLVEKMNGTVEFSSAGVGFAASLVMPGEVK